MDNNEHGASTTVHLGVSLHKAAHELRIVYKHDLLVRSREVINNGRLSDHKGTPPDSTSFLVNDECLIQFNSPKR